jgi:hypothetical protein
MALRRPPSKCWATAAGAERLAARVCARPNLAGCGEVTSPLFSINSILNANWYDPSALIFMEQRFYQVAAGYDDPDLDAPRGMEIWASPPNTMGRGNETINCGQGGV